MKTNTLKSLQQILSEKYQMIIDRYLEKKLPAIFWN
jgi:hypothetical protein